MIKANKAFFQLAGIIVHAADKEAHKPVQDNVITAKDIFCFESTQGFLPKDCALWMYMTVGTKMFTLDAPKVLPMNAGPGTGLDKDHPKGVQASYCIKYYTTKEGGIQLVKGGLVFQQHINLTQHFANLYTMAELMVVKMQFFASDIAYQLAMRSQAGEDTSEHEDWLMILADVGSNCKIDLATAVGSRSSTS